MEKTIEQKENKQPSKVFKVINSPVSIIVVLIIFAICLMLYNRYLINSMTLYTFYGYNDDMTILNGTIYTGFDINYFGDSKVLYVGEDVVIKDYEVGYYIKDGKNYHDIAVMTGLSDAGSSASLKDIVESTDFSFTEVGKEALYMSKENIKNIENLVFRITGILEDDEEIAIEIPLTVTKISR